MTPIKEASKFNTPKRKTTQMIEQIDLNSPDYASTLADDLINVNTPKKHSLHYNIYNFSIEHVMSFSYLRGFQNTCHL